MHNSHMSHVESSVSLHGAGFLRCNQQEHWQGGMGQRGQLPLVAVPMSGKLHRALGVLTL